MSLYQKTTLKNGTRVLTVPSHDTQAVTLLVLFEVGSRYEGATMAGASHYIEHMMFKGTRRRPSTMDISHDLESVGADYNAFTTKDYTGYYIRLRAAHLDLAVDMLNDMLYHSVYKQEELAREREVIKEEINMYEDNPIMHAEEMLEELVYKGSSLARPIAGSHKSMGGIGRKALLAFRDEYYVPSRTVITVAGRVSEDVHTMLEKTFGKVTEPKRKPRHFRSAKLRAGGPMLALKFKETEQVQFTLGFPGLPYGHKRGPAASLLSTILGGGMSSRLFTEVRERRGLAYSIRSSMNPYQDVGNLSIHAGLTKAKIEEGITVIFREISKILKSGVTAEELTRAKEYIKGRTILGLEESSALAEYFARQELMTRKIVTPEDRLAKFDKVTREDVLAAAREIFVASKMSAALIGPFSDKERFMPLLKLS